MAIFDRINCGVVAAGAALCGVALVMSPVASAITPRITGGYECLHEQAGAVGEPAAAGAACAPAAALTEMAGVPLAAPGPVVPPLAPPVPPVPPVVPPLAPPVPPVPPVIPPAGVPPIAAAPIATAAGPAAAGAPLLEMSGLGGKGQPTGPAPAGAPTPGQPELPGPQH